ncbi:hypothetical protein LOD99_3243 [Oopsacas minuta]|uniref:Glutaredoxin domain-containing protein n=1 Tax=Oopsacas minuta TaxID=111878 RepID=A0AAV7JZ40_9METZ|nr:hypothetical protein LOD99_3243 [Oopsacas minuta]
MASSDSSERDSISEDPNNSTESVIMSRSGTVRGIHKGVQNRLSMFNACEKESQLSELMIKLILDEAANSETAFPGKVVFYTTSLTSIREISAHCTRIKHILNTHRINFDERDIFLHPAFGDELRERLNCKQISVPYVFCKGLLVGDNDKLESLNEDGELLAMLKEFQQAQLKNCTTCGNRRFVLCNWCKGSKKGLKHNFGFLKCTVCNVNGLQPCADCCEAS